MAKLIGISGSLRQGSHNSALLRAAIEMMPAGSELEIRSIRDIPLYDGDQEAKEGVPKPVSVLKEAIASSEGLLLATPEYNHSIPGVLKNAIDWLSRPSSDIKRVFGGKPVALMGASLGAFGTVLSQNAWLTVLRALGTRPWFGGRLLVSHAGSVFDAKGAITDDKVREQLRRFVSDFAAFATGSAS